MNIIEMTDNCLQYEKVGKPLPSSRDLKKTANLC